jgi:hypothetical protein
MEGRRGEGFMGVWVSKGVRAVWVRAVQYRDQRESFCGGAGM